MTKGFSYFHLFKQGRNMARLKIKRKNAIGHAREAVYQAGNEVTICSYLAHTFLVPCLDLYIGDAIRLVRMLDELTQPTI